MPIARLNAKYRCIYFVEARMDVETLKSKVRRLEIFARKNSAQLFSGAYKSAFRGQGLDFAGARKYSDGDDWRAIDANLTARLGEPYIKLNFEERMANIIIANDCSASMNIGSHNRTKHDTSSEIAAILAYSAYSNKDKIGLINFSQDIINYIPAKQGINQMLTVIAGIAGNNFERKPTSLAVLFKFLANISHKSYIIVLSDFRSDNYAQELAEAAAKLEIICINISDQSETATINAGLITSVDAETGRKHVIDSSSPVYSVNRAAEQSNISDYAKSNCISSGAGYLEIESSAPYLLPITEFFYNYSRKLRK